MGCSASRSSPPFHFITTAASTFPDHQHPPSNSSTSSQTPISRTMSLPTPLINHPPLRNGDSNHFVSLTSTTGGSLILVENTSTTTTDNNKTLEDYPASLPDSVINT
ncbi:hypothetical protein L1887_23514 [Cichorium endivia]|nr:hypothetical protein L1887_23514 [Cichorium endivia]